MYSCSGLLLGDVAVDKLRVESVCPARANACEDAGRVEPDSERVLESTLSRRAACDILVSENQ